MEHTLLLANSNIFIDSNLIDNIRQSFIDINKQSDEESVTELVNESINYLDRIEITDQIAEELVSLILKCFTCFPQLLLPTFKDLFVKSKINSYRIITTVTVLSYLINNQPNLDLPDYMTFINDSLNEIRPQIQNSNITIFNQLIRPQFKYNLILNYLLCSDMTKETINNFLPYIFSPDQISNNSYFIFFIQKLSEKDLIATLPDSIIHNFKILLKLKTECLALFLPFIPDQLFIEFFDQIKEYSLSIQDNLSPLFIKNIIQKCSKLQLKLPNNLMIRTFSVLKLAELTPEMIEYLNQMDYVLTAKIVDDCPYIDMLLDKFQTISVFSDEQLIQILKKKTKIENSDFSCTQFYNELYSFFSKNDISTNLIKVVTTLFKKFVEKEKFIQIFDEMIFSVYPPTNQGSSFLSLFLKHIDNEYNKLFYSNDHMNEFVSKIIDKKVIPIKPFVEIIDKKVIFEKLKQNQNPLLYYLYCFSKKYDDIDDNLLEMTVLPLSIESNDKLFEYIKSNNVDLFVNFNDDCLSLISCALIFANNNHITVVNGLTKDSILPFYSIAVTLSKINCLDSISTPEMISLLIDGIKSLSNNQNKVEILSIDKILNSFKFSDDVKKQILQILTQFLLNGEYLANKSILLTKIIENKRIVQVDNVIEFIFDHCSELEIKPAVKIDENEVDKTKIAKLIVDIVQNPSLTAEKLIYNINLIQNLFKFELNLIFESHQNLFRLLDEQINENKIDESLVICNFMIKNGIIKEIYDKINNDEKIKGDFKYKLLNLIPYDELTIDEIISLFKSNACPEKNDSLVKALFTKMMAEKTNRIGYFIALFDKLFVNYIFRPKSLLGLYNDKYEEYKDDFIEALDYDFVLQPDLNIFVIRAAIKQFDSHLESNQQIISKIYEEIKENPNNYQLFFCLKCIACTFPFIFQSNPQQIIDIVLPKLDDFHYLFEPKPENEEQEEQRIVKVKTSYAALSFLYSTLKSNKVADFITVWYLTHYKELAISQLHCFNMIFTSLSNENPYVTKALLFKYNFFELFSYLMKIDVEKGFFGDNFNYTVYNLIFLFYSNVQKSIPKFAMAINDHIKIDFLFSFDQDHSLTNLLHHSIFRSYPDFIYHSNELNPHNQILIDFINDVDKTRTFWITKVNDMISIPEEKVNSFIEHYHRMIPSNVVDISPLPNIPPSPTVKMLSYLTMQPKWVQLILLKQERFPTLSEHHRLLVNVVNKLNEINRTGKINDDDVTPDIPIDNFNIKPFLSQKMFNENFLKIIIDKYIKYYNAPIFYLDKLTQIVIVNEYNLKSILSIISDQITAYCNLENNSSVDVYNNIKNICLVVIQIIKLIFGMLINETEKNDFQNEFFDILGNNLIEVFSKPNYRSKNGLLFIIYNVLKIFPCKLPIRVSHLIGFMLLSKYSDIISNGIKLCSIYDQNDLSHMEIIQDTFDNEIDSPNMRIDIISLFLKYFPYVANARRFEMLKMLESLIKQYESNLKTKQILNEDENDDSNNESSINNNQNNEPSINNNQNNEQNNNRNENIVNNNNNANETAANNTVTNLQDNNNDNLKYIDNEVLSDYIVKFLDFLTPSREILSLNMSDSSASGNRRKNSNYAFYPIPDSIYDSLPQFWQFFDDHRPIIDFILLKKLKKSIIPYEIPSLGIILPPSFSSKLVSQFPECFSFEFRMTYFQQKMRKRIYDDLRVSIPIDPQNIFQSSYDILSTLPNQAWFGNFRIVYIGHQGVDAGGITKDWFSRISTEIFNPQSELFESLGKEENYIIKSFPNECNQETLRKYKFIGKIVARALMGGALINAHLTKPFLKQILHHEVKFNDLEDVDENLFKSLKYILENDINNNPDIEFYFSVLDEGGNTIQLKENGDNIKVTDENKVEYINLFTQYRLKKSINDQINSFCAGFDSLIKHEDIRIFTPNELCLLMCGIPEINVEDLKRNVQFQPPFSLETPIVKMFFNVISKWDKHNLSKLLLFITGSSKMPSIGFKFYADINIPIKIAPGGDSYHFPTAHTCTNTLDLPEYKNEDELCEKLLISINTKDFDVN